jgi:putative oxidoreductase
MFGRANANLAFRPSESVIGLFIINTKQRRDTRHPSRDRRLKFLSTSSIPHLASGTGYALDPPLLHFCGDINGGFQMASLFTMLLPVVGVPMVRFGIKKLTEAGSQHSAETGPERLAEAARHEVQTMSQKHGEQHTAEGHLDYSAGHPHLSDDLGHLILRLTAGGLLTGHGSQKLFGWFGGYGLEGTRTWLRSLGLRPGRTWAIVAGVGEFGGGLLTTLGLFHPIGPILMTGPMGVATTKVHWAKPIWGTEGGAELPVTNVAITTALALVGPGRFSLDYLFGIRVPRPFVYLTIASVAIATYIASTTPSPTTTDAEESGAELQGGQEASRSAMS